MIDATTEVTQPTVNAAPKAAKPKVAAKTATKAAPKTATKTAAKKAPKVTKATNAATSAKTPSPAPQAAAKPAKKAVAKSNAKPTKAKTKPAAPKVKHAPVATAPQTASPSNGSVKKKLVRDSFTMPSNDFSLIHTLKERALTFRRPAKKSELLRAGLHALVALNDTKLQSVLEGLAPLKSGRPKKAD